MSKRIDETGNRHGRLVVIGSAGSDAKGQACWRCVCDCGNMLTVVGHCLRRGHTSSCGCYRKEVTGELLKTHGLSMVGGKKTATYQTWERIRGRCNCVTNKRYKDYGGRGIKVCERWDDYENFVEDMGEKPYKSASIERVNNNGDYCPENCKWIPKQDQSKNRRPSSEWNFKKSTNYHVPIEAQGYL